MNLKNTWRVIAVVASALALMFVNDFVQAATLTSITFQQNASAPTCSAGTGVIYYDQTAGALKFCNGSSGSFTPISTSTGSTLWAASGTAAILPGGNNVGIGLLSPSSNTMLQVVGADSLNTNYAANINGRTGTGLIVTNAGNVGIGINPQYLLDVNGTARATQMNYTAGGSMMGTVNGPVIYSQDATLSGRFYNGALYFNGALYVKNDADTAVNMLVQDAGNVGIGNSNPTTAKLAITPGAQPAIDAGSQKIINVATPTGANDAANKTYVDSAAASGGYWTATGTSIYSSNSGNVGVGDSTPNAKLDVNGDIGINGGNTRVTSYPGTTFGLVGGYTSPVAGRIMFGDGTGWKLNFSRGTPASPTDLVTIMDTGSVGIGTSTPAATLHVAGTSRFDGNAYIGNAWVYLGTGMAFRDNGAAGVAFYNSAGNVITNYLSLNGGNEYFANGGGNVGIGVTGPTTKLQVTTATTNDGLLLTDGTKWLRQMGGTLSAGAYNSLTQAGDSGLLYSAGTMGTGGFVIGPWNASAVGIRMDGNGNVGVGKTPATTLDVNGAIAQYGVSTLQYSNSNGSVAVGGLAGGLTGIFNTSLGYGPLNGITSGNYNTAVGYYALKNATSSSYNTAFGAQALFSNTSGYQNTANGIYALYSNTVGSNNNAIGMYALYSNTTGYDNTANGYQALYWNTSGWYNTANGYQALFNNTTGYRNTANGFQGLGSNTAGGDNTADGYAALAANTTGVYNTANGSSALIRNTTGSYNVAVGANALAFTTTNNYNTAVGTNALLNTTGIQNIGLGVSAGSSITTGNYNVVLGAYVAGGTFATASNNLFLSDGAGNLRMRIDSSGNFYYGTGGTTLGTAVYSCPITSNCFTAPTPPSCLGQMQASSTCSEYIDSGFGCNLNATRNCTLAGHLTP